MSLQQINDLSKYSACDISDALLKLETPPGGPPRGGFLDGLVPITHLSSVESQTMRRMTIGPAYTVLFSSKPGFDSPVEKTSPLPQSNIPKGEVWSDLLPYSPSWVPQPLVLISQPAHHRCAALGGIHAQRLSQLGARGVVVNGRVRDVSQLRNMGKKDELVAFAKGTSTVGSGAEGAAWAVQVPVDVGGVVVQPGDLLCADTEEGAVVRVPQELVDEVLRWLTDRGDAEDNIEKFVMEGGTVQDAFSTFRK